MQSTLNFSFRPSELTDQLKQSFNETLTGYWKIQLIKENKSTASKLWYLAVVQGRVICSGPDKLSWAYFIETLKYYVSRLRDSESKQALQLLQKELLVKETPLLSKLMVEMVNMKLISHDDVIKALRLKIISDLDVYLFDYSGEALFIPESDLLVNAPIRGFEMGGLLSAAAKRRLEWKQLRKYIPSPDSTLTIKSEAVESSNLSSAQKQHLHSLVEQGRQLDVIAQSMGKDPLDAAKIFVLMIQRGLVEISNSSDITNPNFQPEVFIVDDSPLLIQQFRHLVVRWGYQVNYSNNALTAVQTMLESQPSAIFLDINMPGASGFELIKQIRRQPKLATIPLVLLTAEKTVSNQWRAQWASCKFLAKPRTPEEISGFRTELRQMLLEMAPTAQDALV